MQLHVILKEGIVSKMKNGFCLDVYALEEKLILHFQHLSNYWVSQLYA